MPPSLRRRAQPEPPSPRIAEPVSDSDEDVGEADDEDLRGEEDASALDADEDEEDDVMASPRLDDPQHSPVPSNFRDISNLASWTVSSSKPGCSIPQLRNPSTLQFWQSDGPQPHWLNIHFFKLVRIVGLRLFLNFALDESYTPTRIVFLAGSGGNDLVEWGEMKLEQPRGWVWADFSGVDDPESESDDEADEAEGIGGLGIQSLAQPLDDSDFENAQPSPAVAGGGDIAMTDQSTPIQTPVPSDPLVRGHPRRALQSLNANSSPSLPRPHKAKKTKLPVLRAHLVQIRILENHQNGKDTHLRGLQVFAKDNEREREVRSPRRVVPMPAVRDGKERRKSKNRNPTNALMGLKKSEWDIEPAIR
ncbi:galactose-binding like protein [Polyplosphaeria fusca]|uniref:Galactose-binding like protein n=1 Tax=Polyplosphaeria fusca TaxID=682080 RepID=A0A9P4RC94_9PLEO|nr:galactose-binding like protein [Polyplosphaeria fusca]